MLDFINWLIYVTLGAAILYALATGGPNEGSSDQQAIPTPRAVHPSGTRWDPFDQGWNERPE